MNPLDKETLLRQRLVTAYQNAWAAAHKSRSDRYRTIGVPRDRGRTRQFEAGQSGVVRRMVRGLKECLENAANPRDRTDSLLNPLKPYESRVLSPSDNAVALTITRLAGSKKYAIRQDFLDVDRIGSMKAES